MSTEEKGIFLSWHGEISRNGYVFSMEKEIRAYCIQDVSILRLACLRFREIFLASTGVDPFREAVTIASACMKVFRRNFLKPETLAIIPPGGYRMADRQSRKALLWLTWEEKEHAGNDTEVRILGRKMDGVHEGTVFEFHGCYFHGCPSCFPNRDEKIPNSPHETMGTRYEATEKKIAKLIRGGYDVIEMWECTFDRLVKENVILSNFIISNPLSMESPINPRDAFFGGRTNCVRLYHDADVENGEMIRYLDVCSLYPYINKYKKYPIGHPKIFVGDKCPPLQDIEGLVKCTVLPPPSLYHPVLPFRANGKLLFPLCRSCALNEQQGECKHSKSERFLTGTWVSEEVKVAVREGYEVIKMHEVWHYDRTTVYDPATGEGGLFRKYIDCFLKIKQEASGFPSWCRTADDKSKYLCSFRKRENIALDETAVQQNPGLRQLSKLMLNSF
ncbi:hypothetical protein J437_LFUL017824 [Ladona fulva]|uniref:DNA-directed DNA polymerase n=1 Tax=Ladona fulva TaxID=123851 RepID=A0A8K0KAH7_LADFU|nr:hypothetical protein J437_LFUL017824 [Ladona fulva]